MDGDIGRAPAFFGVVERHAGQIGAIRAAPQPDILRLNRQLRQGVEHAKPRRIRLALGESCKSGADFAEGRGALNQEGGDADRASASAAVRPPTPPPAITIGSCEVTFSTPTAR